MFDDKSNNIFWKMINNLKENNNNKLNSVPLSTTKNQDSSLFNQKGDPLQIIEKLSTYKKICLLQGLLKEMKSIKERFEDNKKQMLEKITHNCFNYYKSKIGMKEIYDYCISNNPKTHCNYILLENSKEKLSNNYNIIYNTIFLLRNNNDIMINFIKNCPPNSYEKLSEFLVNFFYENTIDSSFNEEELIVIIYLIIEDLIINKLPKSFSATSNKIDSYINNSILYDIFKYITRKADVRDFTITILSENILKLEGINKDLSIDSKKIQNTIKKEKDENKNKNNTNSSGASGAFVNTRRGGLNLDSLRKRNLTLGGKLKEQKKNDLKNPSYITKTDSNYISKNLTSIEEDGEIGNRNLSIHIQNKINLNNVQLNPFFNETDVTLEYLNQKLTEYENIENQNHIANSMKDFIDLQINQIGLDNSEIFSNYIKNKELKMYIALNNTENSEKLIKTILDNYEKITDFIDIIFKKINENITSLPYILKSICVIMEILINKKYFNQKSKYIDYHKLMLLSNYLIGNIILPLITNPDFNGILTTNVISKITKENLEIVTKILSKMLSGKLFTNKKESEYTIFNKYIINTLPKIFDIIISILNYQKNLQLSKKIQTLINSIDSLNDPNRNINYDYFSENQENIQQQSVCFSWLDLIILIDLFKFCTDSETKKKYKNYNSNIEKFKSLREYFLKKYNENFNKHETEFFFIEKINYNNNFLTNINNILQDNIFALFPHKENDNNVISIIKKCLVDVLAYVNILHKENFNYFVQTNKENIIKDNNIFSLLLNELVEKKYKETLFCDGKNHFHNNIQSNKNEKITGNLCDLNEEEKEDADFKEVIFPQIIESVKYELSHNLDDSKAKRIVFCSSYLQLHIDDLPQKYKKNNYSLLLMEIMKKGEEIINELNVSILNQFYLKFKGGEKLNMIIKNNYLQIKKLEKYICIEYLFDILDLPCKLIVKKDNIGVITSIKYEPVDSAKSYVHSIQSFIDIVPNFRRYEKNVEDIIELEEKVGFDTALNNYFKDLKALIKKETIISRFSNDEFENICFDLENYILFKLYDKLFPKNSVKADVKFYKKCCRLDFVKPENLIKDKKMINEKLWKTSMNLINDMDNKLTPQDKVKNFGKGFSILQNSITFCSGKNDLGIDDTISSLIYVLLKAKPKNIFSNSKYCQLFLDPELSKKQYGILLSQIEMIKNIINDMKYSDLIGITEEEFGKDEEP